LRPDESPKFSSRGEGPGWNGAPCLEVVSTTRGLFPFSPLSDTTGRDERGTHPQEFGGQIRSQPDRPWSHKPLTWGEEAQVTPEDLFNRFEKKFDGLMDSISGVADRITRLESQIKSSDDHRASMASALGMAQTEIGELKGTVRIMEERYGNARSEIGELKGTVVALQQAKWWVVGAAAGFSTAISVATVLAEHYLNP
jgi:hypothetical protein